MKVVMVESSQLGVFQRERIVRARRNNNILADLRRMSENASETVENTLAELDHIVASSTRDEVLDDVIPEVRRKDEGIGMSITNDEIVARTARQGIAVRRAQDRAA